MSEQEGCQFDIRMHTECTQCHTSKPLRYALTLTTVGEHSTLVLRIDPMNSALARNAVTLSACALSHNRLTRRIKMIRRLYAHSMKRISRNSPLFSWRTVLVGRLIATTVHIAPLVPLRWICVPEKGRWVSCVKMVNRTGLKFAGSTFLCPFFSMC